MKKTLVVASFLTIALAISACGKKKESRPNNAVTPTAQNKPLPQPPSTSPIQPSASSSVSEIEGTFWTNCFVDNGKHVARKLVMKNDVLSYGIYSWASYDECNEDLTGENGSLETTFYTRFNLVKISDGVMTHRVDYVRQDNSIQQAFVIRLEADKKQFLAGMMSFLTSRDVADYYGTYFKY